MAALAAAVERIVPSDDGRPGALEAGTLDYVLARAAAGGPAAVAALADGVADLDRAARELGSGGGFGDLDAGEQDRVLADLDAARSPFLDALIESTMEGFYGDPVHGGNRDALSWGLIGFPGPTGGAGYRAPLGSYDAAEPPLPGLDDSGSPPTPPPASR